MLMYNTRIPGRRNKAEGQSDRRMLFPQPRPDTAFDGIVVLKPCITSHLGSCSMSWLGGTIVRQLSTFTIASCSAPGPARYLEQALNSLGQRGGGPQMLRWQGSPLHDVQRAPCTGCQWSCGQPSASV